MARVDNIIFCLKAIPMGQQGLNANNILNAINPEYIPGLFSFSVIVCMLDVDSEGDHYFSVEFFDTNNERVVSIENQIVPHIPQVTSNLPNEYKGINIAMDWTNVDFKCSGIYTIVIKYDNCEIGHKEIYVKGKNET